jgi:hypothetical protein
MIDHRSLTSALLLFWAVADCTGSEAASEDFLRFQIDGIDYAVEQPVFRAIRVRDGHFLLELTHQPASSVPGTTVQWQMQLEAIESLPGRSLDLHSLDSSDGGPMSIFTLTRDLAAHGQDVSGMTLQLDRISDDAVEGTFTGTRFLRVSMTEEGSNEINVTAQFRAAFEY